MIEVLSQNMWIGTLLLPFIAATALSAVFRGRASIVWTSPKVRSGIANISLMLFNGLFLAGAVWLAVIVSNWALGPGTGGAGARDWSAHHPILAFLVFFVAKDLADYWLHRAMHGAKLWRLHAVHHTETEMNFTTSFRVHPLEVAGIAVVSAVLAMVLGTPPEIAAAAGLLATLHNFYAHMDVPISHGPLDRIVASPRLHQWHHADDARAHGKNLANVFSLWDMMFGTYHNPGPCHVPAGCRGLNTQHPGELLLLPARPGL